MYAAAEGKSTLGIPKSVGEEFVGKDALADAIHTAINDAVSSHFRADAKKGPTNELEVAKAIRSGELSSPQQYENLWLFDVRITGTGMSYRPTLDEYVYRPPEVFLTDAFVERCNGLPLIFMHPDDSLILNTDEYRNRSIGNVILPYIKGDDVRGIAKVLDADAAELMMKSHASTSPAVVFRDAGSTETIVIDGKEVLVEGDPSYLDHLAICEEGVWDKGKEPNGVKLQEDSTVENENEMPAWADALMKKVDSACSRLDAMENKGGDEVADSFEGLEKKVEGEGYDKEAAEKIAGKVAEEKKAKGDSAEDAEEAGEREEKHEEEAIKELEMAKKEGEEEKREEREDSRKDSKDRKDEAYMDSVRRENAEMRRKIEQMEARFKPLSHADRDALSQAQARADGVAQMFGKQVNAPLAGESPISYRKRLAESFKKYSPKMKEVRMDSLAGAAFDIVEDQIYSDAQAAALSPEAITAGQLIPIVRKDSSGREITTYQGDMNGWLNAFKSTGQVCKLNRNPRRSA